MGETIQITASDGFVLDCYVARPSGTPKGGILVIQEIFGVNSHMRGVADGFAADGYLAYCPALFDRQGKNFEVGYTPEDIAKGRDARAKVPWDASVMDCKATVDAIRKAGVQRVGSVGYCFGGSVAWLTATRGIGVTASVCYYGGAIAQFNGEQPKNPVMMHFGEKDHGIPMSDVEEIRKAHPDAEVFTYPAGHGFNCEQRGDYHADSAKLARQRTMQFFAKHVG